MSWKNIRHKQYTDVLFNKKIIKDKMKRIQGKLSNIRLELLKFVKFLHLVWW